MKDCPTCEGKGYVVKRVPIRSYVTENVYTERGWRLERVKCVNCDGHGMYDPNGPPPVLNRA